MEMLACFAIVAARGRGLTLGQVAEAIGADRAAVRAAEVRVLGHHRDAHEVRRRLFGVGRCFAGCSIQA